MDSFEDTPTRRSQTAITPQLKEGPMPIEGILQCLRVGSDGEWLEECRSLEVNLE